MMVTDTEGYNLRYFYSLIVAASEYCTPPRTSDYALVVESDIN